MNAMVEDVAVRGPPIGDPRQILSQGLRQQHLAPAV